MEADLQGVETSNCRYIVIPTSPTRKQKGADAAYRGVAKGAQLGLGVRHLG